MLKKFISCFMLCVAVSSVHAQTDNKDKALAFLDAIVNQKDFSVAQKYMGSFYIEHDPEGSDGAVGLNNFIQFLRENFPNAHVDVKRVVADKDMVVLHVHSTRDAGDRGQAIVDMFRFENGKIVEHWDVTQDIPEKSANPNGMF